MADSVQRFFFCRPLLVMFILRPLALLALGEMEGWNRSIAGSVDTVLFSAPSSGDKGDLIQVRDVARNFRSITGGLIRHRSLSLAGVD